MRRADMAKAQVSELTSHAGFWLRFVSNYVTQAFSRRLLESGVTGAEWVVLRLMYDSESTSPSELAERMQITRGAASKLVDRLVKKQLVTRRERSDDRRYQEIALTPAGRRLVPSLTAIADTNDEEFFAPLTDRERKALVQTLKKLVTSHGLRKLPTE